MIATWLAGKASGIIIFCIACLSIVLIPAVLAQTVRINGISILGWYAVSGYKPMWEQDERDLVTLRNNQGALTRGLDTCNASVDGIAKAGRALTEATNGLIAAARAQGAQLQTNIDAVRAIKSTDEKCPVASSILSRGFQ